MCLEPTEMTEVSGRCTSAANDRIVCIWSRASITSGS